MPSLSTEKEPKMGRNYVLNEIDLVSATSIWHYFVILSTDTARL